MTTEKSITTYPDTDILMKPGDVLYSHKTAKSSFLVGHTGIIGKDYKVYHVNRWGKKGHSDTMPTYLSRHEHGEKLTILRIDESEVAKNAAVWAVENIGKIKHYTFNLQVNNVERNYCSKFIWQSFYFGNSRQIDITIKGIKQDSKRYITPSRIRNFFNVIGSFYNN